MAALSLRRFTKLEVLSAAQPRSLRRLFKPYEQYFLQRGVELPAEDTPAPVPYERMVRILMAPDTAMPAELIEGLYLAHEMATPQGFEAITEALAGTHLDIEASDDMTALDLAIEVWLRDPRLLERLHAEQNFHQSRTFEYFRNPMAPGPMVHPDDEQIQKIELDLDSPPVALSNGRQSKLYYDGRRRGAWFLVRRRDPLRPAQTIMDGKKRLTSPRAARYDVIAYDPQHNEIRIYARIQPERNLYRTRIGKHLFGEAQYFSERSQFTLTPLISDGTASIVCADIPGLDWIRLREVHLHWGGEHNEVEVLRANDLFSALSLRGKRLPAAGSIIRAAFTVKFSTSRTPRSFVICRGNRLKVHRDGDGDLLGVWMRRRGFICDQGVGTGAAAVRVDLA